MRKEREKWVGYFVKTIFRKMTNLHDQKLASYGLTTAQFGVLLQLWHHDGLTQKELQEKLEIRAASLSGLLHSLELKGCILRKVDVQDARVNRIYLTEEGKKLEHICLSIIDEMEEIVTRGFAQEEINLLLYWLKKVHKNLE